MKNFKLVKTTAALALGASVVTAAVVPGATDASAASKYKVSHGKLVNAKTGKVVKGYVVYKSKLYHNGSLRKGYKTVGTGKSIKLYFNGSLRKGYKTARNDKLLFFNGSLKKGWKTAGAGERLYKNGFLAKGYEVYGDLDKSPSLYYNGYLKSGYKTANNATLLFYNGKLKAGLKDAKGGTVLYDNGRLAKGLVEFNEKFYFDGKLANGEIDGVVYKDGKVVAGVATVKALNATTVEVSFKNAVENLDDLKFTVDGLDVKNAVVKQTDNKTVVLTTAAQEGNKEYTVKLNGDSIGKFTGVSAVIPSSIKLVDRSIQGVLGQEVTVKSVVTVAEGQSKAGIPVTFNITSDNPALNAPKAVEVKTDADGVASYTYTRYAASKDTVVAYANGDRSKFQSGTVHFGVAKQLTMTEVNEGTTVKNGSNKTYKVKFVNQNGNAVSGKTLQVAFLENIDTEINKASTATVNGVNPLQLSNGTVVRTAEIKTDSNGEAVFTVSGTNTSATPVVFDGTKDSNYSSTALQAIGSKVTFSATQSAFNLAIKGEGTSDAATGYPNARKFTVTVTDKDGKVAANEKVKLAFNEDIDNVMSTNTSAQFVTFNANGTVNTTASTGTVTTNAKGEATFYVGSTRTNDYATPFAWIDINDSNASTNNKYEQGEPSAIGEMTYFTAERLVSSKLVTKNAAGTATSNFESGSFAKYEFQLVNQSGEEISFGTANVASVTAQFNVTNTGANDVLVFTTKAAADNYIADPSNATFKNAGSLISPNRTEKVELTDVSNTNAAIYVVPVDKTKSTAVSVTSSAVATKNVPAGSPAGTVGDKVTLVVSESKEAKFTATNEVSQVHTGVIDSFNTNDKTITFAGKDPVKYAGETGKTYVFKGLGGTPVSSASAFIKLLQDAPNAVTATYEVKDDVVTFYIVSIASSGGSNPVDTTTTDDIASAKTDLNVGFASSESATAVKSNVTLPSTGTNGTTVSWASSDAAITNNGEVTRPEAGEADKAVTLTATISKNGVTSTKAFNLTVKAKDFDATPATTPNQTFSLTGLDGYANTDFAVRNVAGTGLDTINGVTFTVAYNAGTYTISATGTWTAAQAADATKTITVTKGSKTETLHLNIAAGALGEAPSFTVIR